MENDVIKPNSQKIYFFKGVPSYFTRILVGNKTLAQMKEDYEYEERTDINFPEKDGINTQYVANNLTFRPNYLIVEYADHTLQRWFVTDDNKIRGQQYLLQLKRDSITDYYEYVKNAPIYLEKCFVPFNSPFIFNSEDISLNQIKKSETLLKDETNVGWIIGYIAPSSTDRSFTFSISGDSSIIDMSNITHTEWEYYQYSINPYNKLNTNGIKYNLRFMHYISPGAYDYNCFERIYYYTYDTLDGWSYERQYHTNIATDFMGYSITQSDYDNILYNEKGDIPSWMDLTTITNYYKNIVNANTTDAPFLNYNNKTIKFSDGVYRITTNTSLNSVTNSNDNDLALTIKNMIASHFTSIYMYDYSVESIVEYEQNIIYMDRIYDDRILNGDIPATANNLRDQPYIMFALPAESFTITDGQNTIEMDSNLGKLFGRAVAEKYSGAGGLYDLQYLPYCPINNPTTLSGKNQGTDFAYIKNASNNNVGVVYFGIESNFAKRLNYEVPFDAIDEYDLKFKNQANFIRLVSPNQQGTFEMNPYKNRGIQYFTAHCTYRPYTPFVYIEPKFSLLYGNEFRDGRGLICGGDFSLPQTTDAYQTYALQNKNFINSFNRSIENMDVNYNLSRQEQIIGGIGNIVSGTIGGAVTGGIVGGPVGAVAGGLLSGAASSIALPLDLKINEKRFNESKSYAIDQFNYNLQNIKARPDSLSKVGSIDYIFKIFPVLEKYGCTSQEEQAFKNKLIYNGMKAMFISTIEDLGEDQEGKYLQGQMIRINPIVDNHITSDIADELKKGVFWN